MAIYRCELKAVSRGQGQSIIAAAAYRAADKLRDRDDKVHNYARKQSVTHAEVVAPDGAPEWATSRETLWNKVDATEKRKDAMLARELVLTLPRELSHEDQITLVRNFVKAEISDRGLVADFAVHEPMALDEKTQPHAHVLFTDRPLEGEGFAKLKDRRFARNDGVEEVREAWANHVNQALERALSPERVSHLSLKAQREEALEAAKNEANPEEFREAAKHLAETLWREPEPKIGYVAMKMHRQGRGEQAHALRDALAVRKDRGILAKTVVQLVRLRQQARKLGETIAEHARDLLLGSMTPQPVVQSGTTFADVASRMLAKEEALRLASEPAQAPRPAPTPRPDNSRRRDDGPSK